MVMNKIKSYILKHKVVSAIAAVIVLYGGYKTYAAVTSTSGVTRYVIAATEKGTIVSTITGSGQVSASNQVDVKSKASGDITFVIPSSQIGQEVKEGTLLAQIDTKDANLTLQNAKLSYQKLVQPAAASTMLQAQNSLADAQDSARKAENDLTSSYTNALSSISSAFIDLPTVQTGMQSLLHDTGFLNDANAYSLTEQGRNYRAAAVSEFDTLKGSYATNVNDYKNISADTPTSTIEALVSETYRTVQALSQAVKDTKATLDYMQTTGNYSTVTISSNESNVSDWLSKMSSHLSDLNSALNNIQNAKTSVTSSSRNVIEQQQSLQKLIDGADPIDVAQQQLSLTQQEEAYDNYFIRAPIDGVLAAVGVKTLQSVSSGTTVATVITKEEQAVISLNEIDAAKVKVGQNATVTFDAIDGLSIAGKVTTVDYIGTVTQGVVTYSVTITFQTDDSRVHPGMSVNTSIATDVAQDVLTVPSGAVQTTNGTSYVSVVSDATTVSTGNTGSTLSETPQRVQVEVGISDDTNTEIKSGLTEGQKVVARTISPSATTATTASAPSLFGNTRAGGTGATRTTGR